MSEATPELAEMEAARQVLGWTVFHAWMGYFAVGGNASLGDVERWISTTAAVPLREHNLLAQALNDGFTDRGLDHPVRYRDV